MYQCSCIYLTESYYLCMQLFMQVTTYDLTSFVLVIVWTYRSLMVLTYLFQMEGWQLHIPPLNPHLGQLSPFLFRSLLYRLLMLAAQFATDVLAVQSWRFVTIYFCEAVKGFHFCHSIACCLSCLMYHKMVTFHSRVLTLFIKSRHKLNRLLNINYSP